MNIYHLSFPVDFARGAQTQPLPGQCFRGDALSCKIEAVVYDSAAPETAPALGSIAGVALRPDGTSCVLTGTDGGTRQINLPDGSQAMASIASVTVSSQALEIPGQVRVTITGTGSPSGRAVTLLSVIGDVVRKNSGTAIDPEDVIDLDRITTAAENAERWAGEAEEAAEHAVQYDAAQTLTDAQKTRARGNIDAAGTLALTQTGIIAPQWENGRFLSDMTKTASTQHLRSAQPIPVPKGNKLIIQLAAGYVATIFEITPNGYGGAENYKRSISAGKSECELHSDTIAINISFAKYPLAAISPEDAADKIHIYTTGGALLDALQDVVEIDDTLTETGEAADAKAAGDAIRKRIFAKSADAYADGDGNIQLSNITEDGFYLINDRNTPVGGPNGVSYTLMGLIVECFSTEANNRWGIGRFTRQTVFEFSTGEKRYTRASNASKVWGAWRQTESGGGGTTITYNNNYTYRTYENTYDITASPEITADDNNYLAPATGDRWAEITAMLQATGVCHLGPGDYHISQTLDVSTGIEENLVPMTLTGCGNRTRLILMASAGDVPAINMQGLALVSDLCICGEEDEATYITKYTAIGTAADTQGVEPAPTERHGILWQGNAFGEEKESSKYPKRGTISNVTIRWFTGGGITARGTGTNIDNCLNVVNCYIKHCMVGVNIPWRGEFNRFTNLHAHYCYIGAENDGGNNIFTGCCFSQNTIGMRIGNEATSPRNNSHGSIIGCIFDHMYQTWDQRPGTMVENQGVSLDLYGLTAGEIFQGCQIFFGRVEIRNSIGVMFDGCNFGNGAAGVTHAVINAAATTGKQTRATFANCVFKNIPTITKTGDNVTVHVIDCMERTSGARIGETGIPAGGTEGQMLAKASGTDYDAEWTDIQATSAQVKAGTHAHNAIVPANQHESAFYALAKAAGVNMASSSNPVGTYTDEAKIAIQKMLGIYEAPWELLNDITLTEERTLNLIADDNGTPYKLRGVYVRVYYAANLTSVASGYARYRFVDENGEFVHTETGRYVANTAAMFKSVLVERTGQMVIANYTRAAPTGGLGDWGYKDGTGIKFAFGNIVQILLYNNDTEPAGTRIQIYGQRAY